jgi:hypothetical protein
VLNEDLVQQQLEAVEPRDLSANQKVPNLDLNSQAIGQNFMVAICGIRWAYARHLEPVGKERHVAVVSISEADDCVGGAMRGSAAQR